MRRGPIIVEETDMTQFMCVKECRKFGYKYAGLRVSVSSYFPIGGHSVTQT